MADRLQSININGTNQEIAGLQVYHKYFDLASEFPSTVSVFELYADYTVVQDSNKKYHLLHCDVNIRNYRTSGTIMGLILLSLDSTNPANITADVKSNTTVIGVYDGSPGLWVCVYSSDLLSVHPVECTGSASMLSTPLNPWS